MATTGTASCSGTNIAALATAIPPTYAVTVATSTDYTAGSGSGRVTVL